MMRRGDSRRATRAGWRAAPLVPRLDAPMQKRILTTLRRGRARRNCADVLAKVGDSITQTPAFLEPLGCGQWSLGPNRALRSTIRFFSARSLPVKAGNAKPSNATVS
jgi:hypothetical protein